MSLTGRSLNMGPPIGNDNQGAAAILLREIPEEGRYSCRSHPCWRA